MPLINGSTVLMHFENMYTYKIVHPFKLVFISIFSIVFWITQKNRLSKNLAVFELR